MNNVSNVKRVVVMKGIFLCTVWIIFACNFMGCALQTESDAAEFVDLLAVFDFETGKQDWEGGISDYPVDYEDHMDYKFENLQVPTTLPIEG